MKILKWVFAFAIVGLGLVTVYRSWSAIKLFFAKKNIKNPSGNSPAIKRDSFQNIFNRISTNNVIEQAKILEVIAERKENVSAETKIVADETPRIKEAKSIVDEAPASSFLEPVFVEAIPIERQRVEVFTPSSDPDFGRPVRTPRGRDASTAPVRTDFSGSRNSRNINVK